MEGFMKARPTSGGAGFTLIELLIVVGIIMLLLTILVPGLEAARRKSVQVRCLVNVRSCVQALCSYTTDNKGKFPDKVQGALISWFGKAGIGGYASEGLQADDRALNKYLGGPFNWDSEVPLAKCPGDSKPLYNIRGELYPTWYDGEGASMEANGPTDDPSTNGGGSHEGLAGDGLVKTVTIVSPTGGPAKRDYLGRRISEVASPVRMIAIAEDGLFAACWFSEAKWEQDRVNFTWHKIPNKFNTGFVDGHAVYLEVPPRTVDGADFTFHREHGL